MIDHATLVVVVGALAGGFASGLTGFGFGLTAIGIWLQAIGPAEAATLVAICSVFSQLQTIPSIWHAIDFRHVAPMIAAGLLGVPVGIWLIPKIDPDMFRLGAGIGLVAFAGIMLVIPAKPLLSAESGGQAAEGMVGFVGGLLGGLSGLSGPPPILWAALKGWSKAQRRGVFQPFNLAILAASSVVHIATGTTGGAIGWRVLAALPTMIVGVWVGFAVYKRLSDHGFHRVVLALLLVSGLGLILPRL